MALQGEHAVLDAQKGKLLGEVTKLKEELSQVNQTRELYMNRVVELQKTVDAKEKFCDLVEEMLKDTYFQFWSHGNLKWMNDYPQVMAQIHSRVLQEAKSTAAGKGGAPFDLEAVRGRFTPDELDAISVGYKRLEEEDAGDEGAAEAEEDIDWSDDGNAGNILSLYSHHI